MNQLHALATWLEPLRPALGIDPADWVLLDGFEHALAEALPARPAASADRSALLMGVRRRLAAAGFADVCLPADVGGQGRPLAVQALMQFVAGYYDTDLRDATGPGHGRLIQTHGTAAARAAWQPRMGAGQLIGIAATERHGGSRLPLITTTARPAPNGTWRLTGEKTWISRLTEASAFVVFFTSDRGHGAVVVSADAPGLTRTLIRPAGLSGWSWGLLHLADVRIGPEDLIGEIGTGLTVFNEHFTVFRPLVTATALGAAAGVHASVTGILTARLTCGILPDLRDTALVKLGETHAQITAALLHTLAGIRLAETGSRHADLHTRTGKAVGTAAASRAAHDLALLIGAAGFQDEHRLTKARRDLEALLLADGIGDELLRSAGRLLTNPRAGTVPAKHDREAAHV